MKIVHLTQNFFRKINKTNVQNNSNQNTLPKEEMSTEGTLPWWWFGSENQLREDWDDISKTGGVSHTYIKIQPNSRGRSVIVS